jgi:sugar phosphate isomerase/epimerase
MENAVGVLDRLAERCRTLGVSLVLENMLPHLFSGHVRDLLWIIGSLRGPGVGICLDTGHAYLSGDLHNVVHKLSGHLWLVHASDNRGDRDDHLPPGDGVIAWEPLLAQLARSGFRGSFILEVAEAATVETTLSNARRGRSKLWETERRLRP